jgi:hypothetical protein
MAGCNVRVLIRGKVWTIRDAELPDAYGETCHAGRTIEIDRGQSERQRLDTLIHELLHAMFKDESEKIVHGAANIISGVLWRDKWRANKKSR